MDAQRTLESEKSREVIGSVPVLHPFLLALYPLLGLYAYNQEKAQAFALMRPALALLLAAALLLLLFSALYRSAYKGGMAASWVLLAGTSGWNVMAWFMEATLPDIAGWSPFVYMGAFIVLMLAGAAILLGLARLRGASAAKAIGLWVAGTLALLLLADVLLADIYGRGPAWFVSAHGLLTVAGLIAVFWIRRNLAQMTWTLNVFGVALLAISFANILVNRPGPVVNATPSPLPAAALGESMRAGEDPYPDIYFIVLGGYANPAVLNKAAGFSLQPFLDEMEAKGFQAAPLSFANYPTDLLSLTSCLNMDYVQHLGGEESDSSSMREVIEWYHQNRLYDFLNERGYTLEVFSPGNESMEPRERVGLVWRQALVLTEFERVLVEGSALQPLIKLAHEMRDGAGAETAHIFARMRTAYTFKHLAKVARQNGGGPRFVQAFLHVPEMPFVFNAEGGWPDTTGLYHYAGRTLVRPEIGPAEYWRLYTEQMQATNEFLREAVDAIISNESRESVIVIASAYGPGLYLGMKDMPASVMMNRYANLQLVRFPGGSGSGALPQRLSLVNLFRVVLNETFGTDLPLREDMLYMPAGTDPIAFKPVVITPAPAR